MADAILHRGPYEGSAEQLTPVLRDPPSLAAAAFVVARLLISPPKAPDIAKRAVASYSVDRRTLAQVAHAGTVSAHMKSGEHQENVGVAGDLRIITVFITPRPPALRAAQLEPT